MPRRGLLDMEFAILLPTLCIILLADAQIFQNQTGIPITQELSGPLADECVSFTRLLGRIKASFAFQSFTNVSDLDCQDKCIAAGSCQSFSFGITTAGVTECLLSVYNRKSQPALFDDNGLIQNFNYYEKSREGCMELAFECGPDRIVVQGQSTEPFSGLVYPEGIFDKTCQIDLSRQRNFSLEIPLQGVCGTKYIGNGLYENVIIIQWDDLIVTRRDRRFKISCQYDLSDLKVSHKPMEIDQITPLEMNLKVPRPDPVIKLINLDANDVNVARVGDNMVFRVELSRTSPYGIFARNCKAQGENPTESLDLIDGKGCPIHPEVFPQLQKNGSALETQFLAFRFRKSFQVFYQCTIDYCVDSCIPVDCSGVKSYGRRKREITRITASVPSQNVGNTLVILDEEPEKIITGKSLRARGSLQNATVLYHPTYVTPCETSYLLIAIILAIVSACFFIVLLAMIIYMVVSHRRNRQKDYYSATLASSTNSKEFIHPSLFGH